jgi:hypothetical protein
MNQALSAQVLTGKHQHECSPSIMKFNNQDRPWFVTLSAAKGLSRWVQRCFAALSMTGPILIGKNHYRGASGTKKISVQNATDLQWFFYK